MILHRILTTLVLATGSALALAQDTQFVSDKQYIPLRSGAGGEYRITHRGIPSGTQLSVSEISEDGVWAQITTSNGTSGWIRTQYLMTEEPAQRQLDRASAQVASLQEEKVSLAAQVDELMAERVELLNQINSSGNELDTVSTELSNLKQISGRAVELDSENKQLVVQSEQLRSEFEMLEAENLRLQDKLKSEDFINGALAVLLGVVIALVTPRLWPKRRRSSSWA